MATVLVRGKIRTFATTTGDPISQWGGTQLFLSVEPVEGPAIVIKSSKHKRGTGLVVGLARVRGVLRQHVHEGKATINASILRRDVSIFIETKDDVDNLRRIAGIVADRSRWPEIEVGVLAAEKNKKARSEAPQVDMKRPTEPVHDTRCDESMSDTATDSDAGAAEAEPAAFALDPTSLSEDQRSAAATALKGKSLFITGSAGTGKSEVLRHILARLPPETTFVTAATAQAARRIDGTTLHSFAGVTGGAQDFSQAMKQVLANRGAKSRWQRVRTLVIDEVSMIDAALLDTLDHIARYIKNRQAEPFGGLQIIAVGDFLQLPPVSGQFCFLSAAWKSLAPTTVILRRCWRQLSSPFFDLLNRARVGRLQDADVDTLRERIVTSAPADAVRIVGTNASASAINDACLEQLDGDHVTYRAEDTGELAGEVVERETNLCAALTLRIGARVIAVANDPSQGIRNGDLGVVANFVEVTGNPFARVLPIVHWIDRPVGDPSLVSHVTVGTTRSGKAAAARTQLPLRLAWALTVHRVQGLSFDRVSVRLDSGIFEAGQGYVAISRARTLDGLYIEGPFVPSAVKCNDDAARFIESIAHS